MPRLVEPAIPPSSLARLRQPVLEVDDLVLRPWRASDAKAVVQAYAEPDIQQWHARSMTGAEARAWIDAWPGRWAEESGAGWAIASASGLLGQISLRRIHLPDGIAEVSYWVVPAARGRGVATRALCALSVWVFDDLDLHRIEVNHSTLNPASCRVAENAGYALEGIKRREALHPDGWHDMHLHARLADDPRPTICAAEGPSAFGRARSHMAMERPGRLRDAVGDGPSGPGHRTASPRRGPDGGREGRAKRASI